MEFDINNTISYCMTERCETKTFLCSILCCWYISVLVRCAISVNCQLKIFFFFFKLHNCWNFQWAVFFFYMPAYPANFPGMQRFHRGSLSKSSELMREVMTTTRDSTKRAMTQAYAPRQCVVYCLLLLLFIVENACKLPAFLLNENRVQIHLANH